MTSSQNGAFTPVIDEAGSVEIAPDDWIDESCLYGQWLYYTADGCNIDALVVFEFENGRVIIKSLYLPVGMSSLDEFDELDPVKLAVLYDEGILSNYADQVYNYQSWRVDDFRPGSLYTYRVQTEPPAGPDSLRMNGVFVCVDEDEHAEPPLDTIEAVMALVECADITLAAGSYDETIVVAMWPSWREHGRIVAMDMSSIVRAHEAQSKSDDA